MLIMITVANHFLPSIKYFSRFHVIFPRFHYFFAKFHDFSRCTFFQVFQEKWKPCWLLVIHVVSTKFKSSYLITFVIPLEFQDIQNSLV